MKNKIQQIALAILIVVGLLFVGIYKWNSAFTETPPTQQEQSTLYFRSEKQFEEHYEKHVLKQQEFGDITKEEYLTLAQDLMDRTPTYVLTKKDGKDTLYYDPKLNSFGVVSGDGFIRTFFKPSDGQEYYDRQ